MRQQRTIAKRVQVDGFGYWSGHDVRLEFRPAGTDTGLILVRGDLNPPIRIPADIHHRTEVPRRTNLSAAGASVEMVEHVLAACYGLQVDNCEIWSDMPEMPGCDGSSGFFADALLDAGIVEQPSPRAQYVITNVTRVGDEDGWIEAQPTPRGGFSVEYSLDYGPGPIGEQHFVLEITPESFHEELAKARTFLTLREATWLRERGLGNRTRFSDLLVFDRDGPLDNALRYSDECARHKTLDMVGDLALAGVDFVGHFIAHKTGHRLNAELVALLMSSNHGKARLQKSA